jgi:tryptophanase
LSQIQYAVDRITWLYDNRELIGGLKFTEEPKVLRFFFGKLEPIGGWQKKLIKKFKEDFGDSL